MRFLAGGFAKLAGRILRARFPWGDHLATIALDLVADTDLRGDESREEFCEWVEAWAPVSRLVTELGVQPMASARCETEQDEPLLLLPDYIAGVYHHADPRTRLTQPVVTPQEASAAVHEFRLRHRDRLFEDPGEFDEVYPLDHQGDRVVLQRRAGPGHTTSR